MRTVRRQPGEPLTVKEGADLKAHLKAFAAEKQHWIEEITKKANRRLISRPRALRDRAVKDGYTSKQGLQARIWKLALTEAAETLDKYYQAHLATLRTRIGKLAPGWSEEKRRYAFWVLCRYETYFDVLDGKVPKPAFPVSFKERRSAANWIRRTSRNTAGRNPVVRLERSLVLDANCYSVKQNESGQQTLEAMTMVKGERLKIRLKGTAKVSGTVRIVKTDEVSNDIAVHVALPVKARRGKPSIETTSNALGVQLPVTSQINTAKNDKGHGNGKTTPLERQPDKVPTPAFGQAGETPGRNNVLMSVDEVEALKYEQGAKAIDLGYTEAFTDESGRKYGQTLGKALTAASEDRNDKGQKRNKLRALQEKYAASSNPKLKARARAIGKYNLGVKKQLAREAKIKANLERIVNEAINQLFQTSCYKTLVTEDLSHSFSFNRGKEWNRNLSGWIRGVMRERLEFKAETFGVQIEAVNSAYSSQGCYRCGFVERSNRSGDLFTCQSCGMVDSADRVAAINLLRRLRDPEISKYTPVASVRQILLDRFHRPLEARGNVPPEATVQGRTLDTVRATTTGRPRARKGTGGEAQVPPRSLKERNERSVSQDEYE